MKNKHLSEPQYDPWEDGDKEMDMTKCFWFGHDWEIIKKQNNIYSMYPATIQVCLRCSRIEDKITPYLQAEKAKAQSKKTRLEQAKDIYANRHNPNG